MGCRAARRLRARLGRRGIFLLLIGTGKACYGAGIIASPQVDPPGLRLLTSAGPLERWAWLWVLAGLVTAGAAFARSDRDWAGFAAALVPPIVWATAYTAAVVSGDYSRGGFIAIWYLTNHVGVILWASGVPEHSVPPPPRRSRRGSAP